MIIPLMEVNAMEGVKLCSRTIVKCQNETSVTRIGEAFQMLFQKVSRQRLAKIRRNRKRNRSPLSNNSTSGTSTPSL
jgi:hypothetical protein